MDGSKGLGVWVVVFLLVLSLGPSVAGGSVGVSGEAVASDGRPVAVSGEWATGAVRNTAEGSATAHLDYDVSLSEAADVVTVEATLSAAPGLVALSMALPTGSRITHVDGFEASGTTADWDGETSEATVWYEIPVGESWETRVNGEDWVYLDGVVAQLYTSTTDSVSVEERYLASSGTFPRVGVMLGNVTTRRFEGPAGDAVVVLPTPALEGTDLLETGIVMTDLGEWFPVGTQDGTASLLIVPEGFELDRSGTVEGYAHDNGIVVKQRSTSNRRADPDKLRNPGLIAHEYAHTRQSFTTGESMAWFTEGSATYYQHRYQLERYGLSFGRYRDAVSVAGTVDADGRLSDAKYSGVIYGKGAHVLTALDVQIRRQSDGEGDLDGVVDRMNAHDGVVTYEDFQSMIAAEAGRSLDGWLDLYVRGKSLPPLPQNATVLAPAGWTSAEAPDNLYFCVEGEWRTRPTLVPRGEPVPVFDASFAVTRFSNAEIVGNGTADCSLRALPDGVRIVDDDFVTKPPRTYVFDGDETTVTLRSAYDDSDVTELSVPVVDLSTPTPTATAVPTTTAGVGTATPTTTPAPTVTPSPSPTEASRRPRTTVAPSKLSAGPLSIRTAPGGALSVVLGGSTLATMPFGFFVGTVALVVGGLLALGRVVLRN